jgi:hypothetical protein
MRDRVFLLTALALAGCGGGDEPNTVREKEAAQVAVARTMTGWDRVFASPVELVGSINQAGFGLPDYAASKTARGYRSEGRERLMSRSYAPTPNMGNAALTGPRPDRVERIAFSLTLADPEDAATARDRMAQLISETLTRAGIAGGERLVDAVRTGTSGQFDVSGQRGDVLFVPGRMDVTFYRPAAIAAAT